LVYHSGLMERTSGEGTILPFGSPAAARLSLRNRPIPDRLLAVAEYGYGLRFSDPLLGLEWCRAAAEACTDKVAPGIRARVLAYLGNSLRVVGNYTEARVAIEQGLKGLPGDPLLLEFKGSLLRDIRELDEAAECLHSASMRRKAAGDVAGYARTILLTAQVMDEAGHSREAATFCLNALDILNASEDPKRHLVRTTVQNYATFLCNAGKGLDALRALQTSKPLLDGGEPLFELRVEWVYAKIAAVLGDQSAESRLLSIRQRLADSGLFQEAALATLDLARYFVRQKDSRAASVALSVAPLLQALGIERDAKEAALLSQIAIAGAESPNLEGLISELYAAVATRPAARKIA
jgi:tetratricopeptide (TPR) repeat protein